jgi:hypothetical protein
MTWGSQLIQFFEHDFEGDLVTLLLNLKQFVNDFYNAKNTTTVEYNHLYWNFSALGFWGFGIWRKNQAWKQRHDERNIPLEPFFTQAPNSLIAAIP